MIQLEGTLSDLLKEDGRPGIKEVHRLQIAGGLDAVAACDRVLAELPDDVDVLLLRSDLNLERGRFDEVVKDQTRLIALRPDSTSRRLDRALTFVLSDRREEALADIREAIRMHPERYNVCRHSSVLYEALGMYTEAEPLAARAAELAEADNPYAFYGWYLLRSRGGNSLPLSLLRKRTAMLADGWEKRVGQFLCGRLKDNELLNSEKIDAAPDPESASAEAYFYVGRLREARGNFAGALDAYESCLAVNRRDVFEATLAWASARELRARLAAR